MSSEVPFLTHVRRYNVAQDILNKKRIPIKKLAEKYGCSERTIKRDIHWIRKETDFPSIQAIVADKVINALEYLDVKEDKKFIVSSGLPFLAKGLTHKAEIKTEQNITSKHVEELNVNLADYETAVQAVVNRYIQTNSTPK